MTEIDKWQPAEGGCPCKTIRYRMDKPPLVVHCCHCTWCQKESGSAFVLNAIIESDCITTLSAEKPILVPTPSASGRDRKMARCPKCQFVVWSFYGDRQDLLKFVTVGTLDDPSKAQPDVHIFTSTKMPWVVLGDSIPVKEEYYEREEIWSKASLQRREDHHRKIGGQ